MILNTPNYFILTGGPGSGKTSVLNALSHRGFVTVPEVARAIIQRQEAIGGDLTHYGDREGYRDLMLKHSIDDYKKAQTATGAVFFDRGLPDLYSYSKAFCSEISESVIGAINQYRYNQTVFLFPPWQDIYQNDAERKQNFQEAVLTYERLKEVYPVCGYRVEEVPKLSINDRVDFIVSRLKSLC